MSNKNTLQRILWTIAGAEIPILEKCRTDHKKFAAIGATILMTAFIAFLSGTSAAWYFTQKGTDTMGNIGWAIAFGIVWSTLIFCIDRSLVITMKKNPEKSSKTWWIIPFISRALLAIIIAFMVSIPLELVVFEDFIAEQSHFWKQNQENQLTKISVAGRGVKEKKLQIDEGKKELKELEEEKAFLEEGKNELQQELASEKAKLNNPTTSTYRQAKESLKNAESKIAVFRRRLAQSDQWSSHSILSNLKYWQDRRSRFISTMNSEKTKWNKPINDRIKTLNAKIEDNLAEINKNQNKCDNKENQINADQERRRELEQQNDTLNQEYKKTVEQGNHFIQNFEILEYSVSVKDIDCLECNGAKVIKGKPCSACKGTGKQKTELPTEWYFLWLIRLLFFIIELLPTVVKIVMPIGAYDRMFYAEEKDMERYLNSPDYLGRIRNMHDMEIRVHEEELKIQKEAEKEIRQKIMEELKDAQMQIAEAALKKWKEEELKKVLPSSTKEPVEIPSIPNSNIKE